MTQVLEFRLGGLLYTNRLGEVVSGGRIAAASDLILECTMSYAPDSDAKISLNNSLGVIHDRIADGIPLTTSRSGGALELIGNATEPVAETITPVRLQSGKLMIKVKGASSAISTDLHLTGFERESGTALGVTAETGGRVFADIAEMQNGMLQPWIIQSGNGSFMKLDAENGNIIPLDSADYVSLDDLPAEGYAIATIPAGDFTIGKPTDIWSLTFNQSGNHSLILNEDLTIHSGGVNFRSGTYLKIASNGGALRFAGEDIVFSTISSKSMTNEIAAPIEWVDRGTGSAPSLVIPKCEASGGLIFSGENRIKRFNRFYFDNGQSSTLYPVSFRGDSVWEFDGDWSGLGAIYVQEGATLIFNGPSNMRQYTLNVQDGRVVLNHAAAPKPTLTGKGIAIVPEEVSFGNDIAFSEKEPGGIVCGFGTLLKNPTILNGTLLGGTPEKAGTLTIKGAVYPCTKSTASGFGFSLGAETNSLILLQNKLSFPKAPSAPLTIRIPVRDLSNQTAKIRGQRFTVLKASSLENYSEEDLLFEIENLSPSQIDISEACAGIDSATKELWIEGLRFLPQGGIFIIR
ncbi:MAG: hypothetical protein ACI4QT_09565, partial [Kiritimatiellia bacterium]